MVGVRNSSFTFDPQGLNQTSTLLRLTSLCEHQKAQQQQPSKGVRPEGHVYFRGEGGRLFLFASFVKAKFS